MSRYIVKTMYLKKPKRLTIWNEGSTRTGKGTITHMQFKVNWLYLQSRAKWLIQHLQGINDVFVHGYSI
jgi:hypothetical protein